MSDVTKTCAICKAPLDADGDCPRAPGFRQPAGSDQIRDKCSHGIYLGTYECTECTGPMSRAELDLIRRWLAGHEKCWPKCDRAPSGEVARLLATIDAQGHVAAELRALVTRLRADNEMLKEAVVAEDLRVAKIRRASNAERNAQERELAELRMSSGIAVEDMRRRARDVALGFIDPEWPGDAESKQARDIADAIYGLPPAPSQECCVTGEVSWGGPIGEAWFKSDAGKFISDGPHSFFDAFDPPLGQIIPEGQRVEIIVRPIGRTDMPSALERAEQEARFARAKYFPGTVIPGHEPLPIPAGLGIAAEFLGSYGQIAARHEHTYPFLDALCRLWLARRSHGATG